jgi:predicted RNase H-like HicB family nuclease
MTQVYFPAIIERSDDSADGYSVFFPDLMGCVSAGRTTQEAARNAEEAVNFHLVGMAEDGDIIPPPSEIDQIAIDHDVHEVARILVRAELPGKKVRVNVMMDEFLLYAIDKVDKNRSRFIDQAARAALARNQ